jgi:two-component system, LytTR family, sensor kinase
MNFVTMKRFFLHALFWFCYYVQFAYTSFLWDKSTYTTWSLNKLLSISLTASVLYMVPQMIFPYYVIYHSMDNLVKKKRNIIINVFEIVVVLFACAVLDRAITNYIALPYMYKSPERIVSLLEIKRMLLAMVYIGFAFGAMFSVKAVRNELAAKEREKNLIKEKLETELKFLKSQTSPHFLLNTLNNIYALARKKSDYTPEVVMRLSELLRFMLYETNDNLIKLDTEIKVLEDYLELETLRYNQRLAVSFEKNIDSDNYKLTPFLLLPFVENAFKHGISETRFESFIHISITVSDDLLCFEIENSKENCEHVKSETNIGLINVKRRLELTYSDYTLKVNDNSETFKVNLSVNLNSYVEI